MLSSIGLLRGVSFCCRPVYSGPNDFPHQLVVVSMVNILMNRTRSKIIRFLVAHGPATCHEVAAAFAGSVASLQKHLNLLRQADIVTLESGRYDARRDEIERQLAEVAATFHSGADGFKTGARETSSRRRGPSNE